MTSDRSAFPSASGAVSGSDGVASAPRPRRRPAPVAGVLALVSAVVLAGCSGGTPTSASAPAASTSSASTASTADAGQPGADSVTSRYGTEYEDTGTGPMEAPTIPTSPSLSNYFGSLSCSGTTPTDVTQPAPASCTRVFHLTAEQFTQHIANFPLTDAKVWGYAAPGQQPSTPGPTLISYQGERVQIVETNHLSEPTTIHPHGLHQPNDDDGVSVISQPTPTMPGQTYTYPAFVPGHVGSFVYHAHFDSAVQEQRGLDGMWDVLPRQEHASVHVDVDLNMTLQIWDWPRNGQLVLPFGNRGMFPYDTINGKTGDASGGPITIHQGDVVRIRLYNASQQTHSMHLHGHDIVLVSKNGHAVPRVRETTQTVEPGDFEAIELTADNPGNWIFHCQFPHHTANGMASGYDGAPVGMTRIFHYAGSPQVNPKYFSSAHYMSPTVMK